jgi:Flp pilus assembly pilin Flp
MNHIGLEIRQLNPPDQLHEKLAADCWFLDTPDETQLKRLDEQLAAFRYVNGSLFSENSGISIMRNLFRRFINDQSGVTVIEYGLIAILIATTLLHMGKASAELVGANLSTTFQSIGAALLP